MKQSDEIQMVSAIYYKVESVFEVQIEECLGVEASVEVIINFQVIVLKRKVPWLQHFNGMNIGPNQKHWR